MVRNLRKIYAHRWVVRVNLGKEGQEKEVHRLVYEKRDGERKDKKNIINVIDISKLEYDVGL